MPRTSPRSWFTQDQIDETVLRTLTGAFTAGLWWLATGTLPAWLLLAGAWAVVNGLDKSPTRRATPPESQEVRRGRA